MSTGRYLVLSIAVIMGFLAAMAQPALAGPQSIQISNYQFCKGGLPSGESCEDWHNVCTEISQINFNEKYHVLYDVYPDPDYKNRIHATTVVYDSNENRVTESGTDLNINYDEYGCVASEFTMYSGPVGQWRHASQVFYIDAPQIEDHESHYLSVGSPPPPNNPPVAQFTVDKDSGTAPLTVRFDGSSSYDPDGDTLYYTWYFGDGPVQQGGVTPDHTYQTPGVYTAKLEVSDGRVVDIDEHTISVSSPPTTTTTSTTTTTTTTTTLPVCSNNGNNPAPSVTVPNWPGSIKIGESKTFTVTLKNNGYLSGGSGIHLNMGNAQITNVNAGSCFSNWKAIDNNCNPSSNLPANTVELYGKTSGFSTGESCEAQITISSTTDSGSVSMGYRGWMHSPTNKIWNPISNGCSNYIARDPSDVNYHKGDGTCRDYNTTPLSSPITLCSVGDSQTPSPSITANSWPSSINPGETKTVSFSVGNNGQAASYKGVHFRVETAEITSVDPMGYFSNINYFDDAGNPLPSVSGARIVEMTKGEGSVPVQFSVSFRAGSSGEVSAKYRTWMRDSDAEYWRQTTQACDKKIYRDPIDPISNSYDADAKKMLEWTIYSKSIPITPAQPNVIIESIAPTAAVVGSTATLSVKVKNIGAGAASNLWIGLDVWKGPVDWTNPGNRYEVTKTSKNPTGGIAFASQGISLGAGQEYTFTAPYTFSTASFSGKEYSVGSYTYQASSWIGEPNTGNSAMDTKEQGLTISQKPPPPAGWYWGDLHLHSDISGGDNCPIENAYGAAETNPPPDYTIEELKEQAKGKGAGWTSITDHSYCFQSGQFEGLKNRVSTLNANDNQFMVLMGEEVSVDESCTNLDIAAHMGAHGISSFIPGGMAGDLTDQQGIDEVKRQGGISIINHPSGTDWHGYDGWDWQCKNVGGETGVEIWNEGFGEDDLKNIEFWKERLGKGTKTFAFGGSDSHDAAMDVVRNDCYLSEFSLDGLKVALKSGRCTVTNGPTLHFSATYNGKNTIEGGEVEVNTDDTVTAKIEYSLTASGTLYFVTGYYNPVSQTYVETEDMVSIGSQSGEKSISMVIKEPNYVRLYYVDDINKKYAFTNPIWIKVKDYIPELSVVDLYSLPDGKDAITEGVVLYRIDQEKGFQTMRSIVEESSTLEDTGIIEDIREKILLKGLEFAEYLTRGSMIYALVGTSGKDKQFFDSTGTYPMVVAKLEPDWWTPGGDKSVLEEGEKVVLKGKITHVPDSPFAVFLINEVVSRGRYGGYAKIDKLNEQKPEGQTISTVGVVDMRKKTQYGTYYRLYNNEYYLWVDISDGNVPPAVGSVVESTGTIWFVNGDNDAPIIMEEKSSELLVGKTKPTEQSEYSSDFLEGTLYSFDPYNLCASPDTLYVYDVKDNEYSLCIGIAPTRAKDTDVLVDPNDYTQGIKEEYKDKNIVLIGGPDKNLVTKYFNEFYNYEMTAMFEYTGENWRIIEVKTGKVYEGDIGLIEGIRNPFYIHKSLTIVGGLTEKSTKMVLKAATPDILSDSDNKIRSAMVPHVLIKAEDKYSTPTYKFVNDVFEPLNMGDASKYVWAMAHSPIALHLLDSEGKEVTDDNVFYYGSPTSSVILSNPLQKYKIGISGTGEGTFSLDMVGKEEDKKTSITYTDIPVTPNFRATINIDGTGIEQKMYADLDGDGSVDIVITPNTIYNKVFVDSFSDGEKIKELLFEGSGKKVLYLKLLKMIDTVKASMVLTGLPYTTQNSQPIAKFSYFPTSPTTESIIQFNDSSRDRDGKLVSYLWNFGDGIESSKQNSTHKFEKEGAYTVKLTVEDNGGAKAYTTKSINVVNPGEGKWVVYSADKLPTEEGWTINTYNSEPNLQTVSGGVLDYKKPAGAHHYTHRWDLAGLDNSIGTTMEARIKVVSGGMTYGYADNSPYGAMIDIRDGKKIAGLAMNKDTLRIGSKYYYMDTTDNFHVYRLTLQGNVIRIYVDGKLAIEEVAQDYTAAKGVLFAVATSSWTGYGESLWDHVKYTTEGAFSPEQYNFPTATIETTTTSTTTTLPQEPKLCPMVCTPLWEIKNSACVFNKCGSGCGPNGITTFSTEEACEDKLLSPKSCPIYIINPCTEGEVYDYKTCSCVKKPGQKAIELTGQNYVNNGALNNTEPEIEIPLNFKLNQEPWQVDGQRTDLNDIKVGDLDGDGKAEIVMGGSYYDSKIGFNVAFLRVYKVGVDGYSLIGERRFYDKDSPNGALNRFLRFAIKDLDLDGKNDIVAVGGPGLIGIYRLENGEIKVLKENIMKDYGQFSDVKVENIAGDSLPEILLSSSAKDLLILNFKGGEFTVEKTWSDPFVTSTKYSVVGIGNVDSDPEKEIVYYYSIASGGCDAGNIYVMDIDNNYIVSNIRKAAYSGCDENPMDIVTTDADGDGKEEIFVAADAGLDGDIKLHKFEAGKDSVWYAAGALVGNEMGYFHRVIDFDVDGDGKKEIIASATTVSQSTSLGAYVFDYKLSPVFNFKSEYYNDLPAITDFADLDGNGKEDIVIAGGVSGKIYTEIWELGYAEETTYPADVALDIGDDGITEWKADGKFDSTVSVGFEEALKDYLENCIEDENGYCTVPVSVSSSSRGAVVVSGVYIEVGKFTNPEPTGDVENVWGSNSPFAILSGGSEKLPEAYPIDSSNAAPLAVTAAFAALGGAGIYAVSRKVSLPSKSSLLPVVERLRKTTIHGIVQSAANKNMALQDKDNKAAISILQSLSGKAGTGKANNRLVGTAAIDIGNKPNPGGISMPSGGIKSGPVASSGKSGMPKTLNAIIPAFIRDSNYMDLVNNGRNRHGTKVEEIKSGGAVITQKNQNTSKANASNKPVENIATLSSSVRYPVKTPVESGAIKSSENAVTSADTSSAITELPYGKGLKGSYASKAAGIKAYGQQKPALSLISKIGKRVGINRLGIVLQNSKTIPSDSITFKQLWIGRNEKLVGRMEEESYKESGDLFGGYTFNQQPQKQIETNAHKVSIHNIATPLQSANHPIKTTTKTGIAKGSGNSASSVDKRGAAIKLPYAGKLQKRLEKAVGKNDYTNAMTKEGLEKRVKENTDNIVLIANSPLVKDRRFLENMGQVKTLTRKLFSNSYNEKGAIELAAERIIKVEKLRGEKINGEIAGAIVNLRKNVESEQQILEDVAMFWIRKIMANTKDHPAISMAKQAKIGKPGSVLYKDVLIKDAKDEKIVQLDYVVVTKDKAVFVIEVGTKTGVFEKEIERKLKNVMYADGLKVSSVEQNPKLNKEIIERLNKDSFITMGPADELGYDINLPLSRGEIKEIFESVKSDKKSSIKTVLPQKQPKQTGVIKESDGNFRRALIGVVKGVINLKLGLKENILPMKLGGLLTHKVAYEKPMPREGLKSISKDKRVYSVPISPAQKALETKSHKASINNRPHVNLLKNTIKKGRNHIEDGTRKIRNRNV